MTIIVVDMAALDEVWAEVGDCSVTEAPVVLAACEPVEGAVRVCETSVSVADASDAPDAGELIKVSDVGPIDILSVTEADVVLDPYEAANESVRVENGEAGVAATDASLAATEVSVGLGAVKLAVAPDDSANEVGAVDPTDALSEAEVAEAATVGGSPELVTDGEASPAWEPDADDSADASGAEPEDSIDD